MTEAIAHRGPDGAGVFYDPLSQIALGHRRLSIIDLSDTGAQPMRFAGGRFTITYNGEIYNYRELRAELAAAGVTFRGTSDTEVLLALYARDGAKCVERLNGIFAFAVWDAERRTLFLARDHLGLGALVPTAPAARGSRSLGRRRRRRGGRQLGARARRSAAGGSRR